MKPPDKIKTRLPDCESRQPSIETCEPNFRKLAERQPLASVFIHSRLDEAGLSPSTFRIFCHVARRGECYSKVESIASICRLSPDTVRAGLKFLTAQGFLVGVRRDGFTTIYRVAPIENWKPSHETPPLPSGGTGTNRHPLANKVVPASHETPPHPSGLVGDEVNPMQVNPLKGERHPPVLKPSERISMDKELGRVIAELKTLGSRNDHDEGSRADNRIVKLLIRRDELRLFLGVVA